MEETPLVDEYGRLVTPPTTTGTAGASPAHVGPIVPPMPAAPRSGRWPAVLRQELAANPTCRGCGRKAETAHHVVPFGVDPARELDPTNLVAVCVPCHFVLCHGGDWHNYVVDCRALLLARDRADTEAIAGPHAP